MADLLVPDIDDVVLQRLAQKAAVRGMTLNDLAVEILTRDAEVQARSLAELLRLRAEQPKQRSDSTATLRQQRDGDRADAAEGDDVAAA